MTTTRDTGELGVGSILERLVGAGVDFVLIGGIAGLAHGSAYPTFDLDIAYARDRPNLGRLAKALEGLDASLRDAPGDLPVTLDSTALDRAALLTLNTRFGPLDLLSELEGVGSYEALRSGAVVTTIEAVAVRVATLDHLIAMKRAAGRPKDVLMVDEYIALADEIARVERADD